MRKLATLSIAIVTSLALAGAASATISAAITGPNTPGTNTYNIVLSYAAGDNIQGYAVSVITTGLYTGVFTSTPIAPFSAAGAVVLPGIGVPGVASSWAAVTGAINGPGGSMTVGTVQITVGAGTFVNPTFIPGDGFLLNGTTTVVPLAGDITGVTIIPEPTTASLLGLGIVGLILAGRKNRA